MFSVANLTMIMTNITNFKLGKLQYFRAHLCPPRWGQENTPPASTVTATRNLCPVPPDRATSSGKKHHMDGSYTKELSQLKSFVTLQAFITGLRVWLYQRFAKAFVEKEPRNDKRLFQGWKQYQIHILMTKHLYCTAFGSQIFWVNCTEWRLQTIGNVGQDGNLPQKRL